MRLFSTLVLAISAVLASPYVPPKTFLEIATNSGLNILVGAIKAADLEPVVNGLKGVTLFAPTNAAFEAIKDTAAKLTPTQLKDILLIHLTSGVFESKILKTTKVPSLNPKETLKVVVEKGTVTVSGSKVIKADVRSSQGIIHVIDKVILPSAGSKYENITSSAGKDIVSLALLAMASLALLL